MRKTYRSNRLLLGGIVGIVGGLLGAFLVGRSHRTDMAGTFFVTGIGVMIFLIMVSLLAEHQPFSG